MNRSPHPHEIDPTPTEVTCVAALGSIAGELPVWSVDEACLWAVDHQGHLIHRVDPTSGAVRSFELPGVVTSLAVHAEGGLIVTIDRRIARFDPESGSLAVLHEVDADRPDNRFNDGKCDRQGRFWAGTMGNTGWSEPVGTLFRLDRDGTLTPTVRGVRCSNGLGWSPDQRTFYYAESFAHVIHAFDYSPRDRHSRPPKTVRADRPGVRLVPRRHRRRRRGLRLERATGLRPDRALCPRRAARAHHRAPGVLGNQLHLRRRRSRHHVRDLVPRGPGTGGAGRGAAGRRHLRLPTGRYRTRGIDILRPTILGPNGFG